MTDEKKEMMEVKIIASQDKTALVEAGTRRVFVPLKEVKDDMIAVDKFGAGLPASFEPSFIMPSGDDVIQALRRRNLWTARDITSNADLARAAVLEVFGDVFTQLFSRAQTEVKNG